MLRKQRKCGWLIAIAVYAIALTAWLTPLLADAEQRATFQANPARYEPLFTEHCPYSLTLGRANATVSYRPTPRSRTTC